jgi:hypothetical protein
MTAAVPTITPIFASPFAVVPLAGTEVLNSLLAPLFLDRATDEFRDRAAAPDALCFRSREDLFEWDHETAIHLRRQMLGGICTAVMAINLYSPEEFSALALQARARFWLVRPDGSIPAASAPMSSWHAYYCVASPAPSPARIDSGALRLYDIRDGSTFLDAANYRIQAPYSGAHYNWRPVPGQIAVFPASILHEVALNRSEGNLILVSARVRFTHPSQAPLPPW